MFKVLFEILNDGVSRDPPDLLPSAIQMLSFAIVRSWKKFVLSNGDNTVLATRPQTDRKRTCMLPLESYLVDLSNELTPEQISEFLTFWEKLVDSIPEGGDTCMHSCYDFNRYGYLRFRDTIVVVNLIKYRENNKKLYFSRVLKNIIEIHPIPSTVMNLTSSMLKSYNYIENFEIRLELVEMGCNGSFDFLTTDLTAYKPLIKNIFTEYEEDSHNMKEVTYCLVSVEVHLENGAVLSSILMERDGEGGAEKFYQILCGSTVIASLKMRGKKIISTKLEVKEFVLLVQDLLYENKKDEILVDFLLLALNVQFEFQVWFKEFRKKFLDAYFEFPSSRPAKVPMCNEPVPLTFTSESTLLPRLPNDIWKEILLYVDDETDGIYTLNKIKTVCKHWYNVLCKDTFWREKYLYHYGNDSLEPIYGSWREKLLTNNKIYSKPKKKIDTVFCTENEESSMFCVPRTSFEDHIDDKKEYLVKAKDEFFCLNPDMPHEKRIVYEELFSQFIVTYHHFKNFIFPDGYTAFKSTSNYVYNDKYFVVTFDQYFNDKDETELYFKIEYDETCMYYFFYGYGKIQCCNPSLVLETDLVKAFNYDRIFLEFLAIYLGMNPFVMRKIAQEKWRYEGEAIQKCYETFVNFIRNK